VLREIARECGVLVEKMGLTLRGLLTVQSGDCVH